MIDTLTQQEKAAKEAADAARLYLEGHLPQAIAALRQAVLTYAAITAEAGEVPSGLLRERADVCQRCGDYLIEAEAFPEAANLFQEAADMYACVGGLEADYEAHRCAQKILASVAALRARPQERLYLLIAHHERQQQQLALTPGTEAQQAEISVQIARIFQRRERYDESLTRYQEALDLYAAAEQTPDVLLACAECHHRRATILANALDDLPAAAREYRQAIALYTPYEPSVYGEQPSLALCVQALGEVEHQIRESSGDADPFPD